MKTFMDLFASLFSTFDDATCCQIIDELLNSTVDQSRIEMVLELEEKLSMTRKSKIPEFVDCLGRQIKPGMLIAYADGVNLMIDEVVALSKLYPYIIFKNDQDIGYSDFSFDSQSILIVENERQDYVAHLLKK